MLRRIPKLVVSLVLLVGARGALAQATLSYIDCRVDDQPSAMAAITRLYDSLEGGPRPTIFLDRWLWNGEDPSTHRIIIGHADYAALEDWRNRFNGNATAIGAFRSIGEVADCTTEGVAVLRGAWGGENVQGPAPYFATYGVAATDSAAYTAAFTRLATSQVGKTPGAILLFENRAGIHRDTHLVVINAPTFAGLNQYLDTLFASREFADFNRSVSSIRTLTSRNQVFRVRAWGAPPNN